MRWMVLGIILLALAGCAKPVFVEQVWEEGNPHVFRRMKGGPPALDYCQIVLYDNGKFVAREQISSGPMSIHRKELTGTWGLQANGIVLWYEGKMAYLPPNPTSPDILPYYPFPIEFPPQGIKRVYELPHRYSPSPATMPSSARQNAAERNLKTMRAILSEVHKCSKSPPGSKDAFSEVDTVARQQIDLLEYDRLLELSNLFPEGDLHEVAVDGDLALIAEWTLQKIIAHGNDRDIVRVLSRTFTRNIHGFLIEAILENHTHHAVPLLIEVSHKTDSQDIRSLVPWIFENCLPRVKRQKTESDGAFVQRCEEYYSANREKWVQNKEYTGGGMSAGIRPADAPKSLYALNPAEPGGLFRLKIVDEAETKP